MQTIFIMFILQQGATLPSVLQINKMTQPKSKKEEFFEKFKIEYNIGTGVPVKSKHINGSIEDVWQYISDNFVPKEEVKENNYTLIFNINNILNGVRFERVTGYSKLGDVRSGADANPLWFVAQTNVREGNDDAFEGVGNTVNEALLDLYRTLELLSKHNITD